MWSSSILEAYGLPLEKAKHSLTWSHGRDKYNNLVFISCFSRLLRSVSEVTAQAPQAQDERIRSSCVLRVVLQGSRFIDFVWEIHFRYQNAKIKL